MNSKEIDELGRDYIKNYLHCLENLSMKLVNDPDDDDTADTIQYLVDSKHVVGEILYALRHESKEYRALMEAWNEFVAPSLGKSDKKKTKKKKENKKK
tara:strand:+ start:358 stop:651 length:294 start_codon:yes stop_codon:yes gene_type:complete